MKFTLGWLKEHLDTNEPINNITSALTDIGLEVESINNPDDKLGIFTICKVVDAWKHPNADRLQVCRLMTRPDGISGSAELVDVVCGAPNARKGMIGVFAPEGSHIPGTGLQLRKTSIKGVVSSGMLCSERELMISNDHEGVIELSEEAPVGMKFIDWAGRNDPVIEIAVTPNRPDVCGILGIARDLAACGLGKLKKTTVPSIEGHFPCPIAIHISHEAKQLGCPVFFGRFIRGVQNGPSPQWMQNRLHSIGLRPISALVDITNYITHDRSRPLHVFDADKVNGSLRVHYAQGGEMIPALDGNEYILDSDMLSISDDSGPESIAGLMGGIETGCTEQTVNVFIESALWDPATVARTGRKLKITSDARYRFERGVDPEFTRVGLELATGMILDICGGEASCIIYDGTVPQTARQYSLRNNRVDELVGIHVDVSRQVEILDALGFQPVQQDKSITVSVPPWRPDISGEADLVEEVTRINSLAKLQGKELAKPQSGVTRTIITPIQKREQSIRRCLGSLDYMECITYSFSDRLVSSYFLESEVYIELENPISSELEVMRPDLLPGLLQAVVRNQNRGFADLALFEVGPVFTGTEPGDQQLHATALLVGNDSERNPHEPVRSVDIYDSKSDLETVLNMISPTTTFKVDSLKRKGWHPEKTGYLYLRPGLPIAIFGEIHPRILRDLKIKGNAVAFSIMIDRIPFPRKRSVTRPSLVQNDLPPVERDFSFVVDNRVHTGEIELAVVHSKFKEMIESINVFDEFSGKEAEAQFGAGKKSIAFCVCFRPKKQAFIDTDITQMSADIIRRVTEKTDGQLRK